MTKKEDDQFQKFNAKEYDMLKDAHFQTSQKITTFFQYAILIFSAPLVLLTSDSIKKSLLGLVFLFIGVVGYFVMLYLSQLRAESLLYARAINQIRKNTYNELYSINKDIYKVNQSIILLAQDRKPKYFDISQFVYIVIVLGLFDSFYFSFGIFTLLPLPGIYCNWMLTNHLLITILSVIFWLALHIISYKLISNYNENGSAYFKRIIGVDIDGVLNKHEEQFVRIYNHIFQTQNCKNKLEACSITTLPVSKSGIIKRDDEHRVFRTREYWDTMPENDDCSIYLTQKIKKELGYKVFIFTRRSWKVRYKLSGEEIGYSIVNGTKMWLKEKNLLYDKIYFEKGSADMPVTAFGAKYRTRYYYSAKYNIKYFIEDDIYNAERLSHICKYVFLINHTYNLNESIELPFNVIRVYSWREILDKINELD